MRPLYSKILFRDLNMLPLPSLSILQKRLLVKYIQETLFVTTLCIHTSLGIILIYYTLQYPVH